MVVEEEKLDLVEHLDELRTRIIRSLMYVALGGVIGWIFYPQIYLILMAPLVGPIREAGGNLQWGHITEGLLIRLTVSMAAGLAIALPGVLYELWAFVAPGLTYSERTAAAPLLPAALALFSVGIATGYYITPRFVRWMLAPAFMPGETVKLFRVGAQIGFMAKLYLAFGACFQLPIILVFLVKAGVVSPDFLASRWREAMLAILAIAALVTPTWDPVTLLILAVPMFVLYVGTIWFTRMMERGNRETELAEAQNHDADLGQS